VVAVIAPSGVVAPAGFVAAGTACGIKASGEPDLSLVAAGSPVPAAAVFTTSRAAAPPVVLGRRVLSSGLLRAVVVNSGCANAGTGEAGLADAEAVSACAAEALGARPGEVLVSSTGPIGPRLPVDRIRGALPGLVDGAGRTPEHALAAARGIMTTDSMPKLAGHLAPAGWRVGGMAKGAGMVRPDLATMLAFVTTDAVFDAPELDAVLRRAVDVTFNCLNVDGCQSTNDTVLVMASGESGIRPDPVEFAAAVTEVCRALSRQMAADAEGASKVVDLRVRGAAGDREARALAMAIADSALVRSSFYGGDPNWGRVLAALGAAGVELDPTAVGIAYEGVPVAGGGVGIGADEDQVAALLAGDFTLDVVVGDGPGAAEVVTTDLTPDYVRFNGERS
jgi:glutamate N-acetyltransferase / amino-acid N-acetyltransferase